MCIRKQAPPLIEGACCDDFYNCWLITKNTFRFRKVCRGDFLTPRIYPSTAVVKCLENNGHYLIEQFFIRDAIFQKNLPHFPFYGNRMGFVKGFHPFLQNLSFTVCHGTHILLVLSLLI